jgi:hypothetical protein
MLTGVNLNPKIALIQAKGQTTKISVQGVTEVFVLAVITSERRVFTYGSRGKYFNQSDITRPKFNRLANVAATSRPPAARGARRHPRRRHARQIAAEDGVVLDLVATPTFTDHITIIGAGAVDVASRPTPA